MQKQVSWDESLMRGIDSVFQQLNLKSEVVDAVRSELMAKLDGIDFNFIVSVNSRQPVEEVAREACRKAIATCMLEIVTPLFGHLAVEIFRRTCAEVGSPYAEPIRPDLTLIQGGKADGE